MSRNTFKGMRGRVVRGWGLVCLTGLGFAGCEMAGSSGDAMLGDLPGIAPDESVGVVEAGETAPPDPVIAAGVEVDDESAIDIRNAAVAYVRQETAIADVSVEIDAVNEGWARLRVFPAGSETDPATLYLRQEGAAWRGVVIGTAFAPPDLDELGIPTSVRP